MSSIKHYSKEVNMTVEQAKSMSWNEIVKFIVVGLVKLIAFGVVLWIIRHV
jgi:hypothetical protein